MSRWRALLGTLVLVLGCGHALDPGAYGTFRFLGRVKGAPPLNVFPPISDRVGNVYTLYGAIGITETVAFVSRSGGGSTQVCALTKGDAFGAHGWVGFSDDTAWYWSGDLLVAVQSSGSCGAVLNRDPTTNQDLQFKAVMPFVRVTSTRKSAVTLVQAATDAQPFSALVDLERGIMSNVVPLAGTGAITVLGVGAERDGDARVTVVARDGKMEADFFDQDANATDRASISGPLPPPYGFLGPLRMNAAGTWAGLTSLGDLFVFTRAGGGTVAYDKSIKAVGVHQWKNALWLVGTSGTKPVVVPLDDAGQPGTTFEWDASERAAAAASGALVVNDDRSFPARPVTWTNVVSALGAQPFVTATSPWPHATDTTLWLVAGPTDTQGVLSNTSIAFAPVGLTYP